MALTTVKTTPATTTESQTSASAGEAENAAESITQETEIKLKLTPEIEEYVKNSIGSEKERIRKEVVAEFEAEQTKQREAAEIERKKKEGDLQGLLDSEKATKAKIEAENAQLKLKVKRGEVEGSIRDYIAEHYKDYGTSVPYILPMVEFDSESRPEDISKRVRTAVDKFVKDNPRATTSVGAPQPPSRTKATGGAGDGVGTNGHSNRISPYTHSNF